MDEGVLGRIGRLVGVAEEAPGEAVAGALVVLHQLRERRPISGGRPRDDRRLVRKRRRATGGGWLGSVGHRFL